MQTAASLNIRSIVLTRETSQCSMGWLKPVASWSLTFPENISSMSVTLDVCQLPMGWLKFCEKENVPLIEVTRDVSHRDRSKSKSLAYSGRTQCL